MDILGVRTDTRLHRPQGGTGTDRVKETTPLEKGVSHKYYAPGVGLVQDDELVLVAVQKPGE